MKKGLAYVICFSPTETSKKGAISIAEGIAEGVKLIDLTTAGTTSPKTEFAKDDVAIFAAPVYMGRLYDGVKTRFSCLKGNFTPCVISVTYGNRDYEDALLEMKDLVTSLGFVPIAAATLIGEHTYGEIAVGRPNDEDLAMDKAFGQKVLAKINDDNLDVINVPGNFPYKEGGSGGSFTPLTNDNCTKCALCAKNCPEQAIDYETFRDIDSDKCISCFKCIRICPVGAKNMDTPDYNKFAEELTKRLSKRRENEYMI